MLASVLALRYAARGAGPPPLPPLLLRLPPPLLPPLLLLPLLPLLQGAEAPLRARWQAAAQEVQWEQTAGKLGALAARERAFEAADEVMDMQASAAFCALHTALIPF